MWDADVAIIACSHRAGGNSDAAAKLMLQAAQEAGATAKIVPVRDFEVLPCLACRACAGDRLSRCVLARKDQAEELFGVLMHAPAVVVASPIYFYGVPSRCKTLVDRSQRFWEARRKGDPWVTALSDRPAFACLVAGQPVGQKLFEGTRLTLKYFLVNFGLTLAEPLGLRGLDGAGDLAAHAEASSLVCGLGREAALHALRGKAGA